ncbi:MAG TPA: PilZ domain-containing protein [Candidatus Acidoferrum sp.]|nr:PilZ domain-containing protein [Candidatus Acidoferrum sp.]
MAYKTRFIGRMEKRLPIAIVVRLACEQDQPVNGSELTYTDNVSAHGVRLVSSRPWKTGDVAMVTSLKEEEVPLRGKVVYCQRVSEGRYYLGLSFNGNRVTWAPFGTYGSG